jgi:beta-hydroxylase
MERWQAFRRNPTQFIRNGLGARYRRYLEQPLANARKRARDRLLFWRHYGKSQYERSSTMLPAGYDRGVRGRATAVLGTGVMMLFDFNQKVMERFCDLPAVYDKKDFPWVKRFEDHYPEIRAEIEAYLEKIQSLPQVAEVSGYDPDSEEGKWSTPGVEGRWRTVIIYLMGKWLEPSGDFPVTRSCVEGIKGVADAGFTGLDGNSHILDHVGPNRGALRFQFPVIVPGEHGDCRIRVVDEIIPWVEGEAVIFDLAVSHEVWNDSDDLRILFMMEITTPLEFPFSILNRFTQWTYRFFPSFRGMHDRIDQLHLERTAA